MFYLEYMTGEGVARVIGAWGQGGGEGERSGICPLPPIVWAGCGDSPACHALSHLLAPANEGRGIRSVPPANPHDSHVVDKQERSKGKQKVRGER